MPNPMSTRLRLYCILCNATSSIALLMSLAALIAIGGERGQNDSAALSSFAYAAEAENLLPDVLSPKDTERYQAIFRAQKKDDWASANARIKQLDNKILLGHVLADRYLHRYNSNSNELVNWLNHYSDHPQAADIYAIAVARVPVLKNDVPRIVKQPSLEGYGDDNGLAALVDDGPYAHMWRAGLEAWRADNKAGAAKWFSGMVQHHDALSPWTVAAAAYWSYRSYDALGNHTEARKYLRLAAEQPRSFYGILARKQLRETLNLDAQPVELTDSDMLQMVGDQAIRRTIALAQAGLNELAEQELRALFPQADAQEKLRLLALAHALKLASVQISMAKHLRADGMLDYAKYPVPNWRPQGGFKVAPELIFALMRQESGFHASAVSHGGALGLMQLMPKTALLMQKNMNNIAGNAAEPELNMMLGQNYVQRLLDNPLVEGNLFYLLAAYNAGPGRLQEWKATLRDRDDPLLFVESIPYPQTRHYVMQVMTNYWIYCEMSGRVNTSIYALLHGRWPSYDETSWPVAVASAMQHNG